jgi:tRNA A-37 threonylcarbamoyl transferase component Bud32
MDDCTFDFAVTRSGLPSASQVRSAKSKAVGGGRKRCRKGKSCSATCISSGDYCLVDFPEDVSGSLSKLKGRVQKGSPLTHEEKSKAVKGDLGAIFANAIQQGKKEQKAPSLPSDLRRQLFALPGADIVSATKKGDMTLMMDDISRIMRGSAPQNLEVALANKGSSRQTGSPTGNTSWARKDAEDFDKSFKIYKRIRGDKDMIDWGETVRNGIPIGEGSFGTVLRQGDMAIKRGRVSGDEAAIIKRVGEAGIGPKLHGAEISTRLEKGYNVDFHNGRIAMSLVPGKEMGDVKPNTKIGGKNAADIYWKSMADLHRLGIAHNDAHVENILIDDKGKGRWVDMGLAQQSPKAALAEALGAFSRRPDTGGNWQTQGWAATGTKAYRKAQKDNTVTQFSNRYPVLGRVVNNLSGVQNTLMRKYGLTPKELEEVTEHGIRQPLSSYNKGAWSKFTDKQAQELLNTLYNGI